MTESSQTSGLGVFYSTPSYSSTMNQIVVNNVQVIGGVGTVYFILVLYKQIGIDADGRTVVNIRMNKDPTVQQVMNCQTWSG